MKLKIKNHFKKVDPVLFSALTEIEDIKEIVPKDQKKFFETLCREIICQQLSNAAGKAIHDRFLTLFPKQPISKRLIEITDKELRETGMSWRKAGYIEGGLSGMEISREFWDIMNEIIFLGYVDLSD